MTRIPITPRHYRRLQNELTALRAPRSVEVPHDPAGERIAGPGMVLTIRYDATGETETLLLGRRGAEDADIKVYSMASPLGRCIAGARPGEQRIYAIPDETGRLVTLLEAVPYRGPSPTPLRRNGSPCQTAGRPDRRPSAPTAA